MSGFLFGEKLGFYKHRAHRKQYEGLTFGDFSLLRLRKKVVGDRHLGVQLEVELECGTSILLGCKDTILDPIQVLQVQQHVFVLNLDVRPLIRVGFEDMVTNALVLLSRYVVKASFGD